MKRDLYYCYSYPLKKFLKDNGEYILVKGINPNNLKRYWVFEKNENLDRLLTEWQLRKNN